MQKQLEMFVESDELDANTPRLDRWQADMRLDAAKRAATKPAPHTRHHRSKAVQCPSCKRYVTIPLP